MHLKTFAIVIIIIIVIKSSATGGKAGKMSNVNHGSVC